jgi:hypothetical protein
MNAVQPSEDYQFVIALLAGLSEGIDEGLVLFRHNEDNSIIVGLM